MPAQQTPSRTGSAVAGLLAAAVGMAVGHLVAAFVAPAASPVLAVGASVIDATPTPVKEWAVRTLGTNDKPVLLGSVALVTAVAAALIGLTGRRRPRLAGALVAGLGAVAGLAAVLRPAAGPVDIVPALAAAVAGVLVLVWLRSLLGGRGGWEERRESPLDHSARAPGAPATPRRRTFLLGAAGAGVGAVGVGALGQAVLARSGGAASVTLPAPSTTEPPLPSGLDTSVDGISPFRTPVPDFYRVDTALVVPRVDPGAWRLEVDGRVDHTLGLGYDDLLAMPMVERDITLNCVSNEVGGPYVSSGRWQGVLVRDLLDRAGVQDGVEQILSESVDGMTISTPVEALTDDRDALVVVGLDGDPLPAERGFPARLLTPGLYGFVGATKWLTRLTATTYGDDEAYWTKRGWATDAPVKTQSRIDTPAGLRTYDPGRIAVGGVAWSQADGGISGVQVRVDDGPWQDARLGPDAGTAYWRQWVWRWEATTGRHTLTARAADGDGRTQTADRSAPFPDGASGYHSIVVLVS